MSLRSRRDELFGGGTGAAGAGLRLSDSSPRATDLAPFVQTLSSVLTFVCILLLFWLLVFRPSRRTVDGASYAVFPSLWQRVKTCLPWNRGQWGAYDVGEDEREALASSVPLVMLVNVKSGGGAGGPLMQLLASSVQHPPDVFPLSKDGISEAIRRVIALRGLGYQPRLVCAGGDGTVTAVIRTLIDRNLATVPVAILPLGTGNDMARTLASAAPRLSDPYELSAWLTRVRRARVIAKDVCEVSFDTYEGGSVVCVRDKMETQLAERAVRGISIMYLSVGIDARLVYTAELHRRRSRALNKLNYFIVGAYNVFTGGRRPPLTDALTRLEVDGIPVRPSQLPCALQSLVCLQIPSYAGGAPLWNCAWPAWPEGYRRMYSAAAGAGSATSVSAADGFAGRGFTATSPVQLRIPVPRALMQPAHITIRSILGNTAAGKAAQKWLGSDSIQRSRSGLHLNDVSDESPVGYFARYRSRFRRLFQRLLQSPTDPYPLPLSSPSSAGAAASALHPLRQLTLSVGLNTDDAWPPQSMDDGCLELVGVRSLVQLSGVVGPKISTLGGVYRLGQPSRVSMIFACPLRNGGGMPPSSSDAPMVDLERTAPPPRHQQQRSSFSLDGPTDVNHSGVALSFSVEDEESRSMIVGDGIGQALTNGPVSSVVDSAPVPASGCSSARGAVQAFLQSPSAFASVVKTTARRIQTHRRRNKAAVLAAPETVDELDEDADSGSGSGEVTGISLSEDGPVDGLGSARSGTARAPQSARGSATLRGYAVVPHGSIASSVTTAVSTAQSGIVLLTGAGSALTRSGDVTLMQMGQGAAALRSTAAGSTSSPADEEKGGSRSLFSAQAAASLSSSSSSSGSGSAFSAMISRLTPSLSRRRAAPAPVSLNIDEAEKGASLGDEAPPSPSTERAPPSSPPPLSSPDAVMRRTAGMRHRAGVGAAGGNSTTLAADGNDDDGQHAGYPSATPSKGLKVAMQRGVADVGPPLTPPRPHHHRGYAPGGSTSAAAEPQPSAGHQPAASSRVPMGGVYADSDPLFLQIDGEGYKVYALRSLDIRWRARARLVTFA